MTEADYDALRQRYAQERDKRLRPDGNDQYIELKGKFARLLEDPYTPRADRPAKHDHVAVTFIGGGFAGLVTCARLKASGIDSVRIVEKGGGFGGTWYWNRYPGAQCDTASMIYLPLLEETGHMPSERYAHAPEILRHCNRIADHFGLHDDALLHTEVTSAEWDAAHSRWIVRTNRGDEFTSEFVGIGTGPLHVAKLPGIDGIETFSGHSFHSSRWDYAYTGGHPDGASMDRLADKRVAIIGTGATAVQCIPRLARSCRELLVFQRTPSSVDVRANQPIDPGWFAGIATPGWQDRWLDNFVANMSAAEAPSEDLVNDGWTDLVKRIRGRLAAPRSASAGFSDLLAEFENADFDKMSEIRDRVDTIVEDKDTAAKLKAWYRQLCKRPCFHDEYLAAFNLPSVRLIDTDGKGVERISDRGVVAAGAEYPVDCIIYASGFEVGTAPTRRYGFDLTGKGGIRLSEFWSAGMRTLHGIHVRGFPNVFLVQLGHGGNFIANVPHNLTDAAKTIAAIVTHMRDRGFDQVDVSRQAEDAWMEQLAPNPVMSSFLAACTPGYYNNEGQGPSPHSLLVGYAHGAPAYFRYIDQWRSSGDFTGLEFSNTAG
ncbi:MAG: NAD(P)/FAD-dependent oxidoreductase [Nocardiopsaceae bacterium]|jgi:cyclohexanone monooxygenase|nr:NAD(P)/FAD-dependent oxidoreductase [Nocardiopsaceae bacterium]